MSLCVADPAARASKKKKQAVIPDSVKREMDLLQPAARSSVSGSSFTRSLRASRVRDDSRQAAKTMRVSQKAAEPERRQHLLSSV